jgi:hypothetical protein
MHTEVIVNLNEYTRTIYAFYWFKEKGMVLDNFVHQFRESKRHKHKTVKFWDRLNRRDNRMERPVVPADVVEQAIEQLRAKIQYCEDPNA